MTFSTGSSHSSSSVPFFFVVPVCQSSHAGWVRLCVPLGILPWVPILLNSLCSSSDQIDPVANSGLKWLYPQHSLPALPGERWLTLSVNNCLGPCVLQTSGSYVFLGLPYCNLFLISKKWEVTRELSQIPQLDWQTMYCCACCCPRLVLPTPSSLSRSLPVPVVLRVTPPAVLLLMLPNSARSLPLTQKHRVIIYPFFSSFALSGVRQAGRLLQPMV